MKQFTSLIFPLLITLSLTHTSHAAIYFVNDPTDFCPTTLNSGDILEFSGTAIMPDNFTANSGSTVNIFGGTIINSFLLNGGTMNLSGGSLDSAIAAYSGELNIIGYDFQLDSNPIPSLSSSPTTIPTGTGSLLTGKLSDHSPFDLYLNDFGSFQSGQDLILAATTLNLILIPEPTTLALLTRRKRTT